jgi:hypothetical protein
MKENPSTSVWLTFFRSIKRIVSLSFCVLCHLSRFESNFKFPIAVIYDLYPHLIHSLFASSSLPLWLEFNVVQSSRQQLKLYLLVLNLLMMSPQTLIHITASPTLSRTF